MTQASDNKSIVVITIDGPSGSGKGTIAQRVASEIGFKLLDSGALYRVLALSAKKHGVEADNEEAIVVIAKHMDVQFKASANFDAIDIILEGENISDDIRTEEIGVLASKIAVLPAVRHALLDRQRAFKEAPGLVADGRDMGTVVFPEAALKVFLTASAEERANRRYKQLKEKGFDGSLARLVEEIRARDERDMNRPVAPLVPADGAVCIDSTDLTIKQVFERVLEEIQSRQLAEL